MSAANMLEVVVVGGGIVGTAAAAFLADGGARVTLVEREGLASGASGANSGVVQQPFDPALESLYHATVGLYRELSSTAGGFRLSEAPAGMLFVSVEEGPARRQAAMIEAAFPDLVSEVVAGTDLQDLEPAVGPDLWACRVGIGYPVVPGASTYAFATLAQRAGATVLLGRAAALEFEAHAVSGVRVGGRQLRADAVLVAAGPSTPALLDPSRRWAPIRPRWGVVVDAELADPPRHAIEEAGIDAAIGTTRERPAADEGQREIEESVRELHFSLVPQAGVVAVGSTFLEEEPDAQAWIEPILVRASTYVPRVADAPIRGVRSCARPQSVDGRPLIGPVPGIDRLFVCAGHGPWGISTGPASARLVADAILGRDPLIPPALDAARFGPVASG